MKKVLLGISLLTLLISTFIYSLSHPPVRGDTMSAELVKGKWGAVDFTPNAFKSASIEVRASMASSLIKKKKELIGLPRAEIRQMLAEFSGHYISGLYPTYLIQEAKTQAEEAWQIVFLIDVDGKIRDIVIQKNCCYN